jgi:hypothetical protein
MVDALEITKSKSSQGRQRKRRQSVSPIRVGIKNLSRRQFFYHCASGDEAAPMKMSLREEQSIAWVAASRNPAQT